MSLVEATAATETAPGEWKAEIHDGWDIGGRANGGYLMALAGRTMLMASGRTRPASITAHFLRPGIAGPVTLQTEVVKEGRQLSTVTAQLAAEKPILQLIGGFTDSAGQPNPQDRILAEPPDLPAPEECLQIEESEEGFPPPLMRWLDLRLHPADNFYEAGPTGTPLIRGWLRLRNDEPWDTIGLLLAADALPPTVFNSGLQIAWTPTVEMTVHIRGVPKPGWLRCNFSSRFITGGYIEEDGELWDESGTLVAQSRQLALVPRD